MKLPDGYIDRFPRRGPWNDVESCTPLLHAWNIEVMLHDGKTCPATFMGTYWRAFAENLNPIAWRQVWQNQPAIGISA